MLMESLMDHNAGPVRPGPPPLLEKRDRIIRGVVSAATLDIHQVSMEMPDLEFVKLATDTVQVQALQICADDAVGMEEAEASTVACRITTASRSRVVSRMVNHLETVAQRLYQNGPSKRLINDPGLLTSKKMQAQVTANPKMEAFDESRKLLNVIIDYAETLIGTAYNIPVDLLEDAKKAKAHGKTVIAVEYCLEQFAGTPNDKAKAKEVGESIASQLKKKGNGKSWSLPCAFAKTIAAMIN